MAIFASSYTFDETVYIALRVMFFQHPKNKIITEYVSFPRLSWYLSSRNDLAITFPTTVKISPYA